MTPRQEAQIGKSYAEMTEQERKDWFGYCFKRDMEFENISESYVCDIRSLDNYGNGYGVIRFTPNPDDPTEEYDPQGLYDIDELKQYMIDYPEMVVQGWKAPLTAEQQELTDIRTNWVNLTDDQLKEKLYETQTLKFADDDIWNGSVADVKAAQEAAGISVIDIDVPVELQDTDYLITWKNQHYTCDGATELATQYAGDDDAKAAEIKNLRNAGKEYIRQVVDEFLKNHAGKPEPPTFPDRYIQ